MYVEAFLYDHVYAVFKVQANATLRLSWKCKIWSCYSIFFFHISYQWAGHV